MAIPTRHRRSYGYMVVCGLATFLLAAFLLASSGFAAPLAQVLLPNFITTAQTTITVTVALADGQTILVPIDLEFVNWHEEEGGYLSLVATTEQQPNMFIGVEESGVISASMQVIVYVTPIPTPLVVAPTLAVPTLMPAPIVVSTPLPTAMPATEIPLQSNGLGMLFDDWKAVYGEPTSGRPGMYIYDKPEAFYAVDVYKDRLFQVERGRPTGSWPSFDDAKLAAQALMPNDAEYQNAYTTESSYVEVYFSQQLADIYPNGLYSGIIGEFIVIYHRNVDDTVASIIVGTGNNP